MNKTLNKDGTPRKTGSGRKKGAKSFVNITLEELQKFCGMSASIPVSRVWLEQIARVVEPAAPVEAEPEAEQKISFTLHK